MSGPDGIGWRARNPNGGKLLLLSLVIPVAFAAFGVAARSGYGETWDEQFDQDIGRFYLDQWEKTGVKGLEDRFIPLQRHYGPLFDILDVRAARLLLEKGLVRDAVEAHHLPVLATASFLLFLVFWFSTRLFGGVAVGLLSQTMLAVMPQFIAHSQNNLKDMPLAASFCLAALLAYEAVRRESLRVAVLAGVGGGLAYAIKINALVLPAIVVLWQVPERRARPRAWTRLAAGLATGGAAAAATVLAVWPYYRSAPLERFLATVRTFGAHDYNELVYYLGTHYRAREVPWHFPFVMLGVNTPIVFLALFLTGAALFLVPTGSRGSDRSSLLFLLLWSLATPVVQAVSGAVMLDGVRHYLLVLPAMAMVAAFGARESIRLLARVPRFGTLLGAAGAAVLAASMADVVAADVRLHPYQVVFFNDLTGGTVGARELFELDYWGASFREAARWMNGTLPAGSRIWMPLPALHFLKIDPSRIHAVPGPDRRPNYKVSLVRGMTKQYDLEEPDYLHPRRAPVWAVTVDGADLLQVFEYPENRDLPDGSAVFPGPPPAGPLAPGLVAVEFGGASFRGEAGPPSIWDRLSFDCRTGRYAGRPAAVRIKGYLRVENPGLHAFEVMSDDDATLWLEGKVLLVNPSLATTRKRVELVPGLYALRMDYRNDAGPACLVVRWTRPGAGAEEVAGTSLLHAKE